MEIRRKIQDRLSTRQLSSLQRKDQLIYYLFEPLKKRIPENKTPKIQCTR